MSSVRKNLKFCSFNIEGLGEKLEEEKFLEIIQNFDFITLVQTWKPEYEEISIDNFHSYSKCCSKHKRAKRHSGGITVLIRNDIRKGVKFFSSKSDRLVWCKLERSLSNLEEDIYVCSVYIPQKILRGRVLKMILILSYRMIFLNMQL